MSYRDLSIPAPELVESATAERWQRLLTTADAVRARTSPPRTVLPSRRRRRLKGALLLGMAGVTSLLTWGQSRDVAASTAANADLFALTNQDRSSNGVGSLQNNPTLAAIGGDLPYRGCGFTVYGRAQDMIARNYFAHPILGCGQLVFAMMQAAGVRYLAAGENIGWDSGTADAAAASQFINTEFMNSPEHRSNILNRAYSALGIGSSQSNRWSGAGGGPYANVWMFSEEFAQLAGTPAPATSSVAARPSVQAATAPPPSPLRNDPAPAPPAQPPLVTQAAPSPTAAPAPTAAAPGSAGPQAADPGAPPAPPSIRSGGGYLSDSVEAVLEAYLVD